MAPRKKFALLFQRGKVEVLPMKQDQRSQLKQRKLSFLAPAKFPFRNQPNKLLKLWTINKLIQISYTMSCEIRLFIFSFEVIVCLEQKRKVFFCFSEALSRSLNWLNRSPNQKKVVSPVLLNDKQFDKLIEIILRWKYLHNTFYDTGFNCKPPLPQGSRVFIYLNPW